MVLKVIFIIVLCLVVVLSSEREPEQTLSVNLISLNIRYGTADDGDNSWFRHRNQRLFSWIKADLNADIFCLQEVLGFQLEEILQQFPHYEATATAGRERGGSGESVPILYDPKKFTLVDSNVFWLCKADWLQPGCHDYGNDIPRIAAWALLKLNQPINDQETLFLVLNCHLDHQSEKSRVKSVAQIHKFFIEAESKYEEIYDQVVYIWSGDFNNAVANSPEITSILNDSESNRGHGYFIDTDPEAVTQGTWHGWTGRGIGPKIDFIFMRKRQAERMRLKTSIVRYNPEKNEQMHLFPTDHWGVRCTLYFE